MADIVALPLLASIPALVLIAATIVDTTRRSDLSLVYKFGWIAVAILLPVFGTFVYLLARPFRDPARTAPHVSVRTEALAELIGRRERGEVDQDAYLSAKRRLFFPTVVE